MSLAYKIKSKLASPYKLPMSNSNVEIFLSLVRAYLQHLKVLSGRYDPLTKLAAKYQTDKGMTIFPFHGYTRQYHRMFEKYRDEEINILEIGLARTSYRGLLTHECPSLSLWLEYFPKANVYGFDIDDFTHINMARTHVFQGDQGEPNDLLKLANQCEGFNIVIDDGSHASSHQQTSLKTLFPYLVSGGLYVIEDLHSQPKVIEDSLPVEYKTRELLQNPPLLKQFVEGVASVEYFYSEFLGGEGEMGVIEKV